MTVGSPAPSRTWSAWIEQLGSTRPDVALMAPFMAYLLLMPVADLVPATWAPAAIALRGIGSLAVFWAFRRHLPAWGRPHWGLAVVAGAVCAWGWVVGQYVCDHFGVGGRLPGMPGEKTVVDPRVTLGADDLFWATWWARLVVATVAVPIVEEFFWRGFLLRALVDWHHFDRVPLGTFTWLSFLGTSLLSTIQHPDNWVVSILCWMAFNALFYWTRSLLCLVLVHGVTNLVLYLITLRVDDWAFF